DEEISRQAAQLISSAIRKKPALTLGLATGSTMVGVYKELVTLHKQGSLDFSRVVTFNLDEYLGLPAAHPQSFHHFMHEKFFAHGEESPRCAITMGIGTILEARKILLLASGAAKAAAVAKSIEGPITSAVSASALQLHPDVTFIIDDAAASQLTQRDYYHRVLEMTALLTPDRLS